MELLEDNSQHVHLDEEDDWAMASDGDEAVADKITELLTQTSLNSMLRRTPPLGPSPEPGDPNNLHHLAVQSPLSDLHLRFETAHTTWTRAALYEMFARQGMSLGKFQELLVVIKDARFRIDEVPTFIEARRDLASAADSCLVGVLRNSCAAGCVR